MKLSDRVIVCADGGGINGWNEEILSDKEIKVKCLMNSGIYMAGCGNAAIMDVVNNFVTRKYMEDDLTDITEIAEAIRDGIESGVIKVVNK